VRILVTGCSGFLGQEIVRQLLQRGDEVVGLSRREVPELVALGLSHHRGDLTDERYVDQQVRDVDTVVHTAAVAGVWGPWSHFFRNNVIASRNVLEACRRNGVARLVFTSSPSVSFDGGHQSGVDESVGYPDRWMCHYPHTKAIAEREILAADDSSVLRTLALRPHLIWGPGDPHLLPRILQRARSGRLRVVGDGKNRVDTVHVVNAAAAHLDATDALVRCPDEAAGRAYFIAQDEPVLCWDWIAQLCRMHDAPPPGRRIPFRAAYSLGATLEILYRATNRRSEPPMTRFVAAQLAKDHFFDISAAKTRLGYHPRMSMEQGLAELCCHPTAGRRSAT